MLVGDLSTSPAVPLTIEYMYAILEDEEVVFVDSSGYQEWLHRTKGVTEVICCEEVLLGVTVNTIFMSTILFKREDGTWEEEGRAFFETALLTDDDTRLVSRYTSYAEALRGHVVVAQEVLEEKLSGG